MNFRKKNILIVDDSELIIDRLTLLLKEQDSVGEVKKTDNYQGALKLLDELMLHIIILDINLGGESGIKLLQDIKGKYPGKTVIMFTNHANSYYHALCKKEGASYFLDKSKDFENIGSIINSIN